jgi:hypothetical protein
MICNLVRREDRWDLYNSEGHKIASTKGHPKVGHTLSIRNCEAIENGYDLDELANDWVFEINSHKWSNNDDTAGDNCSSFKAGFQKALELMGNKMFSEEDIHKAFHLGERGDRYDLGDLLELRKLTEWDVEIEMRSKNIDELRESNEGFLNNKNLYIPKLNEYGFLILKRV